VVCQPRYKDLVYEKRIFFYLAGGKSMVESESNFVDSPVRLPLLEAILQWCNQIATQKGEFDRYVVQLC